VPFSETNQNFGKASESLSMDQSSTVAKIPVESSPTEANGFRLRFLLQFSSLPLRCDQDFIFRPSALYGHPIFEDLEKGSKRLL